MSFHSVDASDVGLGGVVGRVGLEARRIHGIQRETEIRGLEREVCPQALGGIPRGVVGEVHRGVGGRPAGARVAGREGHQNLASFGARVPGHGGRDGPRDLSDPAFELEHVLIAPLFALVEVPVAGAGHRPVGQLLGKGGLVLHAARSHLGDLCRGPREPPCVSELRSANVVNDPSKATIDTSSPSGIEVW